MHIVPLAATVVVETTVALSTVETLEEQMSEKERDYRGSMTVCVKSRQTLPRRVGILRP
ncbi:hypothetical protein [Tateyamaria omphalii]|uniref:hypothetical protein n=1 Tax=Tateyamaria omphalii TaxID=299262 RepID=UPI0012F7A682|nr:hypothetical protein [Tateyamaria omphalii]